MDVPVRSENHTKDDTIPCDDIGTHVSPKLQTMMWDIINDKSKKQPIQQQLSALLQILSKKIESQKQDIGTSENIVSDKLSMFRLKLQQGMSKNADLEALYKPLSKTSSLAENITSQGNHYKWRHFALLRDASEYSVVESTLNLLSKIAMNALRKTLRPQLAWESWFELLCEIISSSSSTHLRSQAKKMMKKLCGGRNAIYGQIRDQYIFGFQFLKLLQHSVLPLEEALNVREKARKCGPKWRFTDLSWATLSNGGLIGTQHLISEDNYVVLTMDKLSKILDELIKTAGSRGNNWKHFCSLDRIPHKSNLHADFCDRSPICLLFWMACVLPSPNQVKIFQLMEIAFGSTTSDSNPIINLVGDDSTGMVSADGGTDGDGTDIDNQCEFTSEKESPQKALLKGASGLSLDDLHAFVISFILNSEIENVRAHACNICLKILVSSPRKWIEVLLKRFMHVLLSDIGFLGCKAVQFLQFLFHFVSNDDIMRNIDASISFHAATSCYIAQLKASHNLLLSSGKETTFLVIDSTQHKEDGRVYDLSNCIYCQPSSHKKMKTSELNAISSESNVTNLSESTRSQEIQRNLNDPTHEFSKRRLDSCTLNSVSTEFTCYLQLKSRLTISEIHLSASDQRGRFAKTIGIFFTPRPVRNINELKGAEYSHLWQRCGVLSLSRASTRATCKFTCPVVAANLKLEYEEFFEKNSGSRPSNGGGIVIHCPRCTRVVNAAHGGVCGNCGEVVSKTKAFVMKHLLQIFLYKSEFYHVLMQTTGISMSKMSTY